MTDEQADGQLPDPTRERWQPLRIGLVELYHYDSEEFWFHDGHLLLRGNNGTGKSKVLSLTLPFLLDAQLSGARIEPGGERNKRMEWNLLLGGKYERRIGYSWIEFGRRGADGEAQFLTLGCGLHAAAGRTRIDVWHFLTGQRMGRDLQLFTPDGTVLSRERLGEALTGRGQRFDTARDYRRAVDEHLFRLGDERYGALMDTLVQLRQPQLSKNPDERALSEALTHALPPLPASLLQEVAEALSQLESYREELRELESLRDAVADFGQRYRHYAAIQSRRQARALRQAQTELDHAARALAAAEQEHDAARNEATEHAARLDRLGEQLEQDRAARDELAADPRMQDARRLADLERQADERAEGEDTAHRRLTAAREALAREQEQAATRDADAERCRDEVVRALDAAARTAERAGVRARHDEVADAIPKDEQLRELDSQGLRKLTDDLDAIVEARRAQIAQLYRRLRELEQAASAREHAQTQRNSAAEAAERATEATQQTATALREAIEQHHGDWQRYLATLTQIRLTDEEADTTALLEWAEAQLGTHPMHARLQAAYRSASEALATERVALEARQATLDAERGALTTERDALHSGVHAHPPPPHTRDVDARAAREGGPLWQLVEFRETLSTAERAGLEAALQSAGLLDAWISPDGAVLDPRTHDVWLQPRAATAPSLADWLEPAAEATVANETLAAVLAGIACSRHDDGTAEAWVAPDGRFRVGPAQGAWHKETADYVGFAAREAARQRRLHEIAETLDAVDMTLAECSRQHDALRQRQEQLRAEWDAMPGSEALSRAHAEASAAERALRAAQDALAEAETALQKADNAWRRTRDGVAMDAEDLQLPATAEALSEVESALHDYHRQARDLRHALDNARRARHEADAQHQRLQDVQQRSTELAAEHDDAQKAVREARARLVALRERVGDDVDHLQQRLAALDKRIRTREAEHDTARKQETEAQRREAAVEQKVADRSERREACARDRQQQAERLEAFAATGLLAVAAPAVELPQRWTVDPALNVARRVEQALEAVDAEEENWRQAQATVSRDFNALQQSLSAQGHRAEGETTDFGFVVSILYGGRPERPDRLERRLDDEIGSRREVLTAREREVLERHLEHEVAQHLQRRLREAEALVTRINKELDARPTSTGVRFRLEWQPRSDGDDEAPPDLATVRDRLVRRSADAWSAEDRRQVGAFLTGCIQAERDRDAGGSLQEHLSKALDYRRWHRFRVRRFAGGGWSALTGPASSGERALGLTVPLFAAASAHYASCDAAEAPRLVLLDEAFAGIDDDARAHCMALIREFDLDFVMTSEREWGCYRELPGVSICHLVRRENIDAVFVSRWHWDGEQRRRDAAPVRTESAADTAE